MLSTEQNWTLTFAYATLAVALAMTGLALQTFYPGAAPLVAAGLLAASLACTAGAFYCVASRLRRLELESEGLVEEISQEFDRVKDKLEIFSEALTEPRKLTPEEVEAEPLRRVTVK